MRKVISVAILLIILAVGPVLVYKAWTRDRGRTLLTLEETVIATDDSFAEGAVQYSTVSNDGSQYFWLRHHNGRDFLYANDKLLCESDAVEKMSVHGNTISYRARLGDTWRAYCMDRELASAPTEMTVSFSSGGFFAAVYEENGKFIVNANGVLSERWDEFLHGKNIVLNSRGTDFIYSARTGEEWFVVTSNGRHGPFKASGRQVWCSDGEVGGRPFFVPRFFGEQQLPAFAWWDGSKHWIEAGGQRYGPSDICPWGFIAVSEDGKVAFTCTQNARQVLYYGGERVFEGRTIEGFTLSPDGKSVAFLGRAAKAGENYLPAEVFATGLPEFEDLSKYFRWQRDNMLYDLYLDGKVVCERVKDYYFFLSNGQLAYARSSDEEGAFDVMVDGKVIESLRDLSKLDGLTNVDQAKVVRLLAEYGKVKEWDQKEFGSYLYWVNINWGKLCWLSINLKRGTGEAKKGSLVVGDEQSSWYTAPAVVGTDNYYEENALLGVSDEIVFYAIKGNSIVRCRYAE